MSVGISPLSEIEALGLLALGGVVAEVVLRRAFPEIARHWRRYIPEGPKGRVFRAYLALGLIPGFFFALIAAGLSFFFFVTFVVGLLAFSVPWLVLASIFLAWTFHWFLSFVPVSLELPESDLVTHFSSGSVSVRPWKEVRVAKVAGPLYAAGGRRWMILGWFLVRGRRLFDAELIRLLPSGEKSR